ncbi:MAG: zinc-ribbon domain-containing protein [Candidatus Peribacteraceae bacterium]|nr:zinc-ribbon domain-containing protein [Candidatus Peribacteraceae bacterium]
MNTTKSLNYRFPLLVEEWDRAKNGNLQPEDVTPCSHRKVWWVCLEEKCRHEWEAFIYNRACRKKPTGCPACIGHVVTDKNNLKVLFPDLCKEWDSEKNKIKPEEVSYGSNKKVWWTCSNENCNYSWRALIGNRTLKINPTGCPSCSGNVVTDKNNISITHPELCKEWDFEKNEIKPEEVTHSSGKKVWWLCGKGHSWNALISNRTRIKKPSSCPACASGPVSLVSLEWLNSLDTSSLEREFYIKELKIRVDGFDPETNTVYEFLGDFWHGNPKVFSAEEINPVNKKPFGQLHQETLERITTLKENGYKVVYIWENDFNKVSKL